MAKLKAVIFSLRNVFFDDRIENKTLDNPYIEKLINLINFLATKNIRVILHTNDFWHLKNDKNISLSAHLESITGQKISYYNRTQYNDMPRKPNADSIPYVLRKENLEQNEVIYIGCNKYDWQACINSKVLFIKATWIFDDADIPYGFGFKDMAALVRFIDICCIQANENEMYYYIDEIISFYTLSPFSTYKPALQVYSASARSTAKQLGAEAEPDFWLMLLISKLYFSGIYLELDAIVSFPGHRVGFGSDVMNEALDIFGKCFRISYLHDAIIRHTQSLKSQNARNSGQSDKLNIYNHLNTLVLNPKPRTLTNKREIKSNYKYKGKNFLLMDDIATAGYSFDAARLLLKAAGANVVCMSWLKTINKDLHVSVNPLPKDYPIFSKVTNAEYLYKNNGELVIPYNSMITNRYTAGTSLAELFKKFIDWNEFI